MQYPLTPDVLPEFCTSGTFMRLPAKREGAQLAIVGMPFDTAASYRVGARFAPQAVRQASMTLFPYHSIHQVYPFADLLAVDVGDIPIIPHNIHRSYELMQDAWLQLLQEGIVPIGIGGDHSVTLANLRAIASVYGPVALIHFDSHTDTWDTYYGEKYWHGSPFVRAFEEGLLQPEKVYQLGIRGTLNHPDDIQASLNLGYHVITTDTLCQRGFSEICEEMRETIGDTPCFLSFDVDFVDPAFAPGTGTLEIGGFSSRETQAMIRALTNFNFVGFDVVEVLPQYDPSQITCLLAATMVHEFAALAARRVRTLREITAKGRSIAQL